MKSEQQQLAPDQKQATYQSPEEIQEILLQELENLFDKPCLIPISSQQEGRSPQNQPSTTSFKIGFEKDYTNTFLITNPSAIFKFFAKEQFLYLPESTQCILLERLEDILQKCSHNSHILTDHIVLQNVTRLNQPIIQQMANQSTLNEPEKNERSGSVKSNQSTDSDLILLVIQIGLKLSNKNLTTTKKIIDLIRKLTNGRRFYKCHLEYIYQYLKIKATKLCKEGKSEEAMKKVDTGIKMLNAAFESKYDNGPTNFFYFSGFLSGIQVKRDTLPPSEFMKGFAASMWFEIMDNTIQDDKNLPVLFNCFFQGYGGFECYFNYKKLYYRILPKVYTPPTVESNGVLIGEFQPKKWYFFAIEHEKPFMTRPQFTAIINDKQVVTLPMDYPKIEKGAKISMIAICKNFVGKMSTFMLFKEQISHTKKLIQMFTAYEHGLYSSQNLQKLNTDIFDQKMMDKLFILYTPERTSNKNVYDCIEMRDGELMINSGVCNNGPKSKLFFTGGLNSLLPPIELIQGITLYSENTQDLQLDATINEYLKLIISILSNKSYVQYEADNQNFFSILFYLITKLPYQSVNNQTISNLADIRFLIGDSKLQEQFFKSLMQSSDYWINTDNLEVINEYWLFVKAIYQQNPVQYNRMFSIQNLIDLMVKISDIKEGHCCEYHRETYLMFYQGIMHGQHHQFPVVSNKSHSLVNEDRKQLLQAQSEQQQYRSNSGRNLNPFKQAPQIQQDKIYHLEKYLAPIAGVLEGVLTSGGNEVLDQIQYIAKALTVKSSPCFHLQMLLLLKVLLLDSKEDRHCASPADFAAQLLKAKGLQILLYLCSNSSFDVKSMCVKLIDVISSHTSLIKIAIDPDVITYLCNIILPRQMMDVASITHKNQMFKNMIETDKNEEHIGNMKQYEIMDEEDEQQDDEDDHKSNHSSQIDQNIYEQQQLNESKDLEDQIDQLIMGKQNKQQEARKKFGRGLFLEDENDDNTPHSDMQQNNETEEQDEAEEIQIKRKQGTKVKERISLGGFIEEQIESIPENTIEYRKPYQKTKEDMEDEELILGSRPPPPAPKNRSNPFKFDFDSDQSSTQSNEKMFNQTSKPQFKFGKTNAIKELIEEDEEKSNEDQEDQSSNNEFGILGFQGSSNANDKKKFMNTQKLPTNKGNQGGFQSKLFTKGKGLQLNIFGEEKQEQKKPTNTRNAFVGGLNKQIEFAEVEDNSENEEFKQFETKKTNKKETFANENVMSKSNLRQPKSFNFGFPADEDDEEEEEKIQNNNDVEDIADTYEKMQLQELEKEEDILQNNFFSVQRDRKQIEVGFPDTSQKQNLLGSKQKRHQRGKSQMQALTIFDEETLEEEVKETKKTKAAPLKKKNLVIGGTGGTTGATSDTMYEKSHSRERNDIQEQEFQQQQTQQMTVPKKAVISFKKNAKLFTNANQKLNIDTEAINELFNYGGEQGKIMMTEDEEMKNFEIEIEELASMCLAAMNRKNPNDPIKYENQKREKTSFESKYLKNEQTQNETGMQIKKNPRSQFMTPQSVRGIKKIEFSMSQEEKNAALEGSKERINLGGTLSSVSGLSTTKNFGLKSGAFANNTIMEEISPSGTSKSSSSRQDFAFGGIQTSSSGDPFRRGSSTNLDDQTGMILSQKKSERKPVQHMSFNQLPITQEAQEFQILDLKVKKKKSSNQLFYTDSAFLSQPLQKLDGLELTNRETEQSKNNDDYTAELENLYTSCLEWIISRAPSSLYENIVIDECDKIGYQPAIQLLMTLVTYSNNIIRQRALNDLEMLAKWDSNNGAQIMMHPQFHTWLLELLMPFQDLANKYSKLQGTSLAVYDIGCKLHTLLLKNACISQEEEAYKKINFLVRWPEIVQMQCVQGLKDRTERDVETAHKLTRILLTQLISSLREDVIRIKPQLQKTISPTWQNLIYISYLVEEMILTSHSKDIIVGDFRDEGRDFNVSLFKWIQKDYLLYYSGSTEQQLWAEWDLIDSIFLVIDSIFPDWTHKSLSNTNRGVISLDEQIYNLLEKCSADEFNSIVEILVHDGSPYKSSHNVQSSSQYSQVQKQGKSKGKGILNNMLGQATSHFKNQQQQLTESQQQQLLSSKSEQSFMKNILNMICIALTQADTKQTVQLWLDRYERFVKYIMIVSETWKSRLVSTVYSNYQRKFTEAITFAFKFLFQEIHCSNRSPSNMQLMQLQSLQHFQVASSPRDSQLFNKIYAQSLKNLMIYFINIVEFSKIKYTPSQLETHITACRTIFNQILVKNYQQGQVENLITHKDIARFKQSDYYDFPECFHLEEWKVVFNSELIKNIVKRQLNMEIMQQYLDKRKNYAQHYLDTQISNEKTKDDILKRMQIDTVEVIGQLSEEEFERKNKIALMNDNFMREQSYYWKQAKKYLFGPRGIWRNIGILYLKMNLFRAVDGVRMVMNERYTNGFEYLETNEDLERKIFNKIDSCYCDLFMMDKNQIMQAKQLISQRKKQRKPKKSVDFQNKDSDDDEDDNQEEDEDDDTQNMDQNINQPIVQFFSRQLTTREKISLKKQYINHLKEYISTFRQKNKEITELRCQILKPFYQRPGMITLTSHDIIFFDDLFIPANLVQEKDNIFFFKYQKKNDELLYKIIPLPNLKEIQRRRWLGRKTALEVYIMDGKSILINFLSYEEREHFAKKVIRQRSHKCSNLKYYDTLDPKRILKKRELTEKWMQWKISNFEYLMQLNQLAGRSYLDLSQYPVFPWILLDSQSPPDLTATSQPGAPPPLGFRDLNKNMQLHGSAERQAEFKKKYDDFDSFSSLQEKFHCGSHYSNPGIVLHYLSRLSPYIDALVELHGKNLDTPDRGFHSVIDSLQGALNDHSDVRELVPEFFYCPEMFMNMNKIKFGVKQDGVVVDNVKLPDWTNNDPYNFVTFLREAFESQYVSQNLGGWIDYIFGYKQKDLEAEKCLNTFSRLTYEDGIDIDSVNDQLLRQGYQEQIYNYGQTPSQLFQKTKHPQKLPKNQALKYNCVVDNSAKIKVYKPVVQQAAKNQSSQSSSNQSSSQVLLSQEAILKAKFVDEQGIIGLSKDGTVTYFLWLNKAHDLNPNTPFTCCEDKKRKFDNKTKLNGIEVYDRSIKKFDFPMIILNTQKCVMRGGFWNGKIAICPIEGVNSEQQSSLQVHQSTVTAIVSSQNERTVISGSKNGDIIVWNYIGGNNNPSHESNWVVRNHMCDHEGMVSMIHINEEMCMYITSSFDGTVNLYNFFTDKLFRSFSHPKLSPIHSAILSQTPLPACAFFSREDHIWYSFSLNGHLLDKQKEESSHIISPLVIKDSHFIDRLVYGTEKGYLIFRQLPSLKQIKKQQVSTSFPVLSIIVSSDRRFLLVGCGDGGLNVVTEPFTASLSQGASTGGSSSGITSAGSSSLGGERINTATSIASSFVNTQTTLGGQSFINPSPTPGQSSKSNSQQAYRE